MAGSAGPSPTAMDSPGLPRSLGPTLAFVTAAEVGKDGEEPAH